MKRGTRKKTDLKFSFVGSSVFLYGSGAGTMDTKGFV
jgi:hypothetical protein